MKDSSPTRLEMTVALATAVLAISSAASFVLLAAPLHPLMIACLRVCVTGVGLALLAFPALIQTVQKMVRSPILIGRIALAGALLALHFGTWIASLSLTSVVQSVALVSTQPLFAGIFGRLLGDRAPWRLVLGAAVAVLGSAVMASGSDASADSTLAGNLLAVVAAAAAAGYLVVGRSVKSMVPLSGYLSMVNLFAAGLLATVVVASPGVTFDAVDATAADYVAVVAMGLVPGIVGHGLLNWGVRHIPVHMVSLVILLEPLGAALLAWMIVGAGVTGREAWGAAILLVGVAVGLRRKPGERKPGRNVPGGAGGRTG